MSDETTPAAPQDVFENAVSIDEAASEYTESLTGDQIDDLMHPPAEEPEPAPAKAEEEEPAAEETKPEGEEPAEKDATEGASEAEEESTPLETLSDLAERLEVPVEELAASLKHTFNAAGEEHTVSLDKLVEGYQLRADYDRSKTKLAQTRNTLQREAQERTEAADRQMTEMAARFNTVDKMLATELESPEMADLRSVNPAEWAARHQEIRARRENLNTEWQQATTQRDTDRSAQQEKFYAEQGRILADEVDGWGEDTLSQAFDVFRSFGFESADMGNLMEHRLVKGALETHKLREENKALQGRLAAGAKAATKVKKTVPKMVKPGATKTVSVKAGALDSARKAFKRNPSARNAARMFELTGNFE